MKILYSKLFIIKSLNFQDQRVVYRFLKDIKDEERNLESGLSDRASSAAIAERAQSLEDILDNLKKYILKIN